VEGIVREVKRRTWTHNSLRTEIDFANIRHGVRRRYLLTYPSHLRKIDSFAFKTTWLIWSETI